MTAGTTPTFVFARGAPIVIDLVVDDAGAIDPVSITVAMRLKPASGGQPPAQAVAAVAEFAVEFTPATATERAYWRGTVPGTITRDLKPGDYATDAQLARDGTVIAVTRPALVRVRPSVTPQASVTPQGHGA